MTDSGRPRRWIVRGRVQGVGFRVFVTREAVQLRLRGTVRNTDDGAVDVVAVGGTWQLDDLQMRLWQGPEMAHVTDVETVACAFSADSLPRTFMITD